MEEGMNKEPELTDKHRYILERMKRSSDRRPQGGDFPYRGTKGGLPRHWNNFEEELRELTRLGYLKEAPHFQGSKWQLTKKARTMLE
jgi:hypothetical protein